MGGKYRFLFGVFQTFVEEAQHFVARRAGKGASVDPNLSLYKMYLMADGIADSLILRSQGLEPALPTERTSEIRAIAGRADDTIGGYFIIGRLPSLGSRREHPTVKEGNARRVGPAGQAFGV